MPGSDHDPERMTRGARRGFVIFGVLMLVVGLAGAGFTWLYANSTAARLQRQQQSACAFARDLGSVTLPARPRPSRVGVLLVADSRAQWQALHCPGTLPPSPGLAHWEAVYHLPAS